MCMEYKQYLTEIKSYCSDNNLDFTKLLATVKGCGSDDIIFQHFDPKNGKMGLLDETPMPVVLRVKRENGMLLFEQTENTKKYLT